MGETPPDIRRESVRAPIQACAKQAETMGAPPYGKPRPEVRGESDRHIISRGWRDGDALPSVRSVSRLGTGDLEIGEEELQKAEKGGLGDKCTALSPDGLEKKTLALAMDVLDERFRQLFNSCLK